MWKHPPDNLLTALYLQEVFVGQWVQNTFAPVESALLFLSEHFTPAKIMDIYVPLVGAFNHQLLVSLVATLGVINVFSSLIKWSIPACRPYWWIREHNETDLLQQYCGTCETTAAFPSSHCLSFTTFLYLVAFHTSRDFKRLFNLFHRHLDTIAKVLVTGGVVCMALSRIYLAAQFPHQAVVSCIVAIAVIQIFDKYSESLLKLSCLQSISIVFVLSVLPIIIYFGMLQLDLDPHWSVRMAFKWCSDPAQMRHEDSSIFVLGRDFGYLMGVALSAPLYQRYKRKASIVKRIPLLLLLEVLNYYARLETPKNYGRVAFVTYEYLRNTFHSFTLLNILQKLTV